MRNHVLLLLVATSLVTLAATADAKESRPEASKSDAPDHTVALVSPTAPLPESGAPVESKRAAPETTQSPAEKDESSTGPIFDFGLGMRFVQGALSKRTESFNAYGITLGLRGAYYFTSHLGAIAGIEGSVGYVGKGCVGGEAAPTCGAYSIKLPLTLQHAFESWSRGPYVEGGLSFFNVQVLSGRSTEGVTESITMLSPVDATLGAGYRFALHPAAKPESGRGVFDLSLRGDIGQYTSASVSVGDASVDASIASGNRAFHAALSLSIATRF